jgi:hypothetical protein
MRYTTTAIVNLPVGVVLGLSESQAAARRHALEPKGRKGTYVTTQPVQFKVGESLDYEGDLPKSLAQVLEEVKRPVSAGDTSKTSG